MIIDSLLRTHEARRAALQMETTDARGAVMVKGKTCNSIGATTKAVAVALERKKAGGMPKRAFTIRNSPKRTSCC